MQYVILSYLKANRDLRSITKLTFDLKHVLKAEKIKGTVKNTHGKYKSCPTWRFKEARENFVVTINQGQKQLLNLPQGQMIDPEGLNG